MTSDEKPHVLYLGDWVFHIGPMFVETPFNAIETKDCSLHFYGQRLKQALEPVGELTCMANWELYHLPPGQFEQYLFRSRAVIISDVEARCFHLYPAFFDRAAHKNEVVTFPDRLHLLKSWIEQGGGLIMLGGWLSFSGARECGGWRRTCVAEALPVECLLGEDLVESSAGFAVDVVDPDNELALNLPWGSFPPVFGYNEVAAKRDAKVVVKVRETGDPLVVTGGFGRGRIFIYASDPAPHWGLNFMHWEGYDAFWQRALRWVARAEA